jgi:hypothetical protein
MAHIATRLCLHAVLLLPADTLQALVHCRCRLKVQLPVHCMSLVKAVHLQYAAAAGAAAPSPAATLLLHGQRHSRCTC